MEGLPEAEAGEGRLFGKDAQGDKSGEGQDEDIRVRG